MKQLKLLWWVLVGCVGMLLNPELLGSLFIGKTYEMQQMQREAFSEFLSSDSKQKIMGIKVVINSSVERLLPRGWRWVELWV